MFLNPHGGLLTMYEDCVLSTLYYFVRKRHFKSNLFKYLSKFEVSLLISDYVKCHLNSYDSSTCLTSIMVFVLF